MKIGRFEVLGFGALIAGLNFYFSHELFRTEYLDNFYSNEAILVTLGSFFAHHPFAKWFPLWNVGLPVENTYAPVMPAAIALLSSITPLSPPLCLHIIYATFFCLVPVAWFWLMWRWGLSTKCALAAGLFFSLLSPSAILFPDLTTDLSRFFDSRRMMDLAYYGDIAHLIATGFLPLALFAIERAARTGRTGYCLGAIFLSAVTVLSNQFGITSLSLCALAVLTSLDKSEVRKAAIRVALIGAATYLCVCRILTPTLLALISKNAQLLGGDYRFTKLTLVGWAVMLAGGAVIRFGTARAPFAVRFAALLAWIFTGTLAIFYVLHIPILPVTQRYHLEADVSLSILIAVLIWQLPVRVRQVVLAIALMAAIPQTIWTRRLDRPLLKAADIEKTVEYQGSRWIGQNLPGVRAMVGGDATFWFDYFTENPQLSGGHDGMAPNFMQRIAVYAIYTGENAGDRDAQYSIFWMKAFGTSAIYVAGPASTDRIHPFARPRKFEGVLPKLWQVGDTAVYAVPTRSLSLAHVVPASAVVVRQPTDGLDTAPAEPYVRALDDESLPEAALEWASTDRGRIDTVLAPGQVVSVQVTYDPGWIASSGGKHLTVRSDALGMIVIEPACTGPCQINLEFTGGAWRTFLLGVSVTTIVGLCLWGAFRRQNK
jgi:hypothetical protein